MAVEVTIKIGNSTRYVIAYTLCYSSIEYTMYDEEMGRCNFIQFLNIKEDNANLIQDEAQKHYDNFEKEFRALSKIKLTWKKDKVADELTDFTDKKCRAR